jgi:SsrA-binding protein
MAQRERETASGKRPSPVHRETHLCYDPHGGGIIMTRSSKKDEEDGIKVICRNRRAYHEYVVLERMECGIVLTGTEVKSLREGVANLEDAYAKIEDGELWLLGSDIPEYAMGNRLNHKPKRSRKLLLHRREIEKFAGKATQRGFTLVPLRMYFKQGRAKVELAVAHGKQLHDKRQAQKNAEAKREIRKAMTDRKR